jgi:hypothetical protein
VAHIAAFMISLLSWDCRIAMHERTIQLHVHFSPMA